MLIQGKLLLPPRATFTHLQSTNTAIAKLQEMPTTIQVLKIIGIYLFQVSMRLIQINSEIDCSTRTILHDNLYGLLEHHFAANYGHIRFHCLHLRRSRDYPRPLLPERTCSSWRHRTAGRDGRQRGRRVNRDGSGYWISLRNTLTRGDVG